MRKFTLLASVSLAVILFMFNSSNSLQAQNVAKITTAPNGDTIPYLEYHPSGYASPGNTRKYPVIIFLHGGGEQSNNVSLVKPTDPKRTGSVWKIEFFGPARLASHNKMGFIWNNQKDTFIVLSPMARSTTRTGGALVGTWAESYVTKMVDIAKADSKVDTNRIYLTGLSFGGGGTFRWISQNATNPKRIAAALSMSGDQGAFGKPNFQPGGPQYVGDAKLPVWGFHAARHRNKP